MEQLTSSFAQFARDIAGKHVPEVAIEAALSSLGGKAAGSLEGLNVERRGALINHFVRSIKNIGVHTASQLEHELLARAGCCPAGRRIAALKDAISIIAVRNHLHQMATSLGLSWKEAMRLQSAVSDVARFVVSRGGGRIELDSADNGLFVTVYAGADLGPIPATGSASAITPAWLAGTMNLVKGFRCSRTDHDAVLEFLFETSQSMVA
jgi:hypothetical protein